MSSKTTITLQQTANWVAAFIVQRPTVGVGGTPYEPFLTSANKVMATILAPPFKWSWNREESSAISTTVGQTDYEIELENFGFLEKATISTASGSQPPAVEIEVVQVLASEAEQNRPFQIAPILDDNEGNITFRLLPAPDQEYTVNLTFQHAPLLASDLNGNWAPIPDKFSFLYEIGMMAHMQAMYSPQLYSFNMEMFFKQLVGAAEGLTETEKYIFLEDQLKQLRAQQYSGLGADMGKKSRV
jgi:hypothetical protein